MWCVSLGGFQVTPCSSSHPLRLLLSNTKQEKRELFPFRISRLLGCKHVSQHSALLEFQTAPALTRRHRRKNCTTLSDLEVRMQQHLFKQHFQEQACYSPHFCSTRLLSVNSRLEKCCLVTGTESGCIKPTIMCMIAPNFPIYQPSKAIRLLTSSSLQKTYHKDTLPL